MEPSLHPKTLEPLRGLVELVESHRTLPAAQQAKPLSKANTERFGHVDPCMWTPSGDRVLTLEEDIKEILQILKTLKITEANILDQ